MAEFLKAPIAIIDKRRPKANVAEVMNIIGHVEGKTCVLIDDMIDTAGTISLRKRIERSRSKRRLRFLYTSRFIRTTLQRIEDSAIERLVVTDSIYLSDDRKIAKLTKSALVN